MNMFARFDENPAMTLRVIKETKRYGPTHGQREKVFPPQTKFAGGGGGGGGDLECVTKVLTYVLSTHNIFFG